MSIIHPRMSPASIKKPSFSIITPVKDDEKIFDLVRTFQTMKSRKKIEFLIIFNGSNKDFILRVKEASKILSNMRFFNLKSGNIAKAINYGLKKINSSKIVIVDSDCLMDDNFIEPMIKAVNKHLVVRGDISFSGFNFFSKMSAKLRSHIYKKGHNLFFAPNLALDKIVFQKVGYFNETIHIWDSEFGYRVKQVGIGLTHEPGAKLTHVCGDKVLGEFRIWVKYGEGDAFCYQHGLMGNKTFFTFIKAILDPWVLSKQESLVYNFFAAVYACIENFGFLKTMVIPKQYLTGEKL